ncbi:hypothetical protein CYLTODRAFT_492185 [Cylindrobasidium torrendii FP15055 ss-10]|uniref:MYND-type domain-containing protein n=1 Tax=Cylindrobasidium torrendii FP15055 ss-10 TaxID=1314674 RepID=A0A0D7B5U1_9AGAR|nr:hypothetical protein CYLTODRAFT_492185 [Cylindrobasidium torrendii FP15055 ss-10]
MEAADIDGLKALAKGGSLEALQALEHLVLSKQISFFIARDTILTIFEKYGDMTARGSKKTPPLPIYKIMSCVSILASGLQDKAVKDDYDFIPLAWQYTVFWSVWLMECAGVVEGATGKEINATSPYPEIVELVERAFDSALSSPRICGSAFHGDDPATLEMTLYITRLWLRGSASDNLHSPNLLVLMMGRWLSHLVYPAPYIRYKVSPKTAAVIKNAIQDENSVIVARALSQACSQLNEQAKVDLDTVYMTSLICLIHVASTDKHYPALVEHGFYTWTPRILKVITSRRSNFYGPAVGSKDDPSQRDAVENCVRRLAWMCERFTTNFVSSAVRAGMLVALIQATVWYQRDRGMEAAIATTAKALLGYVLWPSVHAHVLRSFKSSLRTGLLNKCAVDGAAGAAILEIFRVSSTNTYTDTTELKELALRKCANLKCKRKNAGPVILKRCGGCLHYAYCSKECQRLDWARGHKQYCNNLKILPQMIVSCPAVTESDDDFMRFLAWRDLYQYGNDIRKFLKKYRGTDTPVLVMDYRMYVRDRKPDVYVIPFMECDEFFKLKGRESEWEEAVKGLRVSLKKAGDSGLLLLGPNVEENTPYARLMSREMTSRFKYDHKK